MAEIVVCRQNMVPLTEAEKEVARRVLFGLIDGLGEQDKKSWRRLWNWFLNKAEPGEFVSFKTHRERIGWFHRKHMAMEQRVFQSQERFENFTQFRMWLKVGAGHVDWLPGPKGGVIPVPKSISYAELEEDDMRIFHEATLTFFRTPHAIRTLWKHLGPQAGSEMMELALAGFDDGATR